MTSQRMSKQSEGLKMPILCISLPRLGVCLRTVIVIVIYLAARRTDAWTALAVALGGTAGGLLIIERRPVSVFAAASGAGR